MDVTFGKNKASANVKAKMNLNVGKKKASAKVQAKVVRKPLGDLTNTLRPRALEKPSIKSSVDNNVSAVDNYDWVKEEGFLHNHHKCIECQRNAKCAPEPVEFETSMEPVEFETSMELDEFETRMELDEFETPMELVEFDMDLYVECSPARPPTRKTPGSPLQDIDSYWFTVWDNMSPFKLK